MKPFDEALEVTLHAMGLVSFINTYPRSEDCLKIEQQLKLWIHKECYILDNIWNG